MEDLLLPLAFIIITITSILILLRKIRNSSNPIFNKTPPGPPGLPLIGNLHQIDGSAPHEFFWELSRIYGPLMSMKLGSKPLLVVSSAKMAEQVMKTHDLIFCSRPAFLSMQKVSYNGHDIAFAPYNEYWREIRKICVLHLFSLKKVQSFRPIREEEARLVIKKISNWASAKEAWLNSSQSQTSYSIDQDTMTIDVAKMMISMTKTMVMRMAFGKWVDEESPERRRDDELFHELQSLFKSFCFADYFPAIGWMDKITGFSKRLEEVYVKLDTFYQEVIEEHLSPNRPPSMDGDLVDVLLQLKQDPNPTIPLTFDHIKAVILDVFSGGTETSASTITWAMTALIKNPRVMKKVQAEIRERDSKTKTSNDKKPMFIDEEESHTYPYLKAVIKETLRMHPPVPLLVPRETTDSCVINGYQIKPKTLVYVNAWGIGRDPEYWKNPEEFLPERFSETNTVEIMRSRQDQFGWIPFGAGRRGCPGMSLAVATVELVLANLLYLFDWELPRGMKKEDVDTQPMTGLTVFKKNPLLLVPKKYIPA